jgi:hypothetical protein
MRAFTTFLPPVMIAACVVVLSGCSFTTAHFEEVTMAKSIDASYKPVEKTKTFHKSDPILHCSALIANAPKGTKVKAVWLYKPEGKPVVRIDSAEVDAESRQWVDFNFSPANEGLPYGNFAVDLFIESKLQQSVPFTVTPMYESGIVREAVIATKVNEGFRPADVATTVSPNIQVIYLPVYLSEAPAGTVVTVKWYQEKGGQSFEVVSTDYPIQQQGWTGWIGFSLKLTKLLPVGPYRGEVLVNGAAQSSHAFSVK